MFVESSENKKNIKTTQTKKKKNYVSDSSSEKDIEEVRNNKINEIKEKEIEQLKLNLITNTETKELNNDLNVHKDNDDERIKLEENQKNKTNYDDFTKGNEFNEDKSKEIMMDTGIKANLDYNAKLSSEDDALKKENKKKIDVKDIINKNEEIDRNDEINNQNSYYKADNLRNSKEGEHVKGFNRRKSSDQKKQYEKKPDMISLDQKGFGNVFNSNRNERNSDFRNFPKDRDDMENENNFRFNNNRGRGRGNRGGRNFNNRDFKNENYRIDFGNRFNDNNSNRGRRLHIDDYKFFTENEKIIKKLKEYHDFMDENDIIKHLKIIIQNGCITIFEFLNEFYRENILKKHEKFSNVDDKRNYSTKINIFEQDKDSLDPNTKFIIENYKTIPKKDSEPIMFPSEYYETEEEKRRKIYKDENGFFNYIPIKCNEHIMIESNEYCKYSHNENEINYHSLIYKTQFCSKNCFEKETCKNAHDAKEFRKIYEFNKKDGFVKFILKIEKFLIKKNLLKDYLDYVEVPVNFSLDTFKVHQCKFKSCNIDPHLCYFYHNEYERRRYPKLFNLVNKECENRFVNANDLKTRECLEGDFCKYFHNKYEMVYHECNFRRQIRCQRLTNKSNGKCIYYETCYAIHKVNDLEDNENYNKLIIKYQKLKEKANSLAQVNKDLREKLSEFDEFSKALSCRNCGDIFEEFEIVYTSICEHLMCLKCLDKSIKNNKKCCIICGKKIEKGSLIKLHLNPEKENNQEENNEIREKKNIKNKNKVNNKNCDSD